MKIKLFFPFILAVLVNSGAYAQAESDKARAMELARTAVKLEDDGNIDTAIVLLNMARNLDSSEYTYPYELGYVYYMKKDYKKAVAYYEKVITMDKIDDQCFQMLGNSYDMNNQRDKAEEAYEKGLALFPKSGKLNLELGNIHQDDWNKALGYYEKGIQVDPLFRSNYYWASRIFCHSDQEVWGMIYGEIFMNMERNTNRTREISKLLFDTYSGQITFSSDTSYSVSFCKRIDMKDDKKTKLPFCLCYEPCLALAVIGEKSISLGSLNRIRTKFIDYYYDRKFNKPYPNLLFDWHERLIKQNMFECYNYWLLKEGALDEFNKWYNNNTAKMDVFIKWFSSNPMPINEKNKFSRLDY